MVIIILSTVIVKIYGLDYSQRSRIKPSDLKIIIIRYFGFDCKTIYLISEL